MLLEFRKAQAELTENLEQQRWTNLTSAVYRDGDSSTVRVVPSFVAASLSSANET